MLRRHAARYSERYNVDIRFKRGEHRAVHRPGRMAPIVDAVRIEIRHGVTINVDSNLDHADQLKKIDHGLPIAIALADGPRARSGGDRALVVGDHAVAVLVDAAARVGERYRGTVRVAATTEIYTLSLHDA